MIPKSRVSDGVFISIVSGLMAMFEPTTAITTSTVPIATTEAGGCSGGAKHLEVRGEAGCSFICGLSTRWPITGFGTSRGCTRNGQVYPRGVIVPATCPEICWFGQWTITPCHRCCEEYDNCETVCQLTITRIGRCDALFPQTSTTFTPSPTWTSQISTSMSTMTCGEGSVPGDIRGEYRCARICPTTSTTNPQVCEQGGSTYNPGDPIPVSCSETCGPDGQWRPTPCAPCCEFDEGIVDVGEIRRKGNGCELICEPGAIRFGQGCDTTTTTMATIASKCSEEAIRRILMRLRWPWRVVCRGNRIHILSGYKKVQNPIRLLVANIS